jgi:hypothetical protein
METKTPLSISEILEMLYQHPDCIRVLVYDKDALRQNVHSSFDGWAEQGKENDDYELFVDKYTDIILAECREELQVNLPNEWGDPWEEIVYEWLDNNAEQYGLIEL